VKIINLLLTTTEQHLYQVNLWIDVVTAPRAFIKYTLGKIRPSFQYSTAALPNDEIASSRPKRTTTLPSRYDDFVSSDSDALVQQLLVLNDNELEIPIDSVTSFPSALEQVSSTEAILCSLEDDSASDPQSLLEAKRSKYWTEWLSAIHSELESLRTKGVYEEVRQLPPHRKAVKCKWVLHIKRDKSGSISRFKARLVAKGFTQIPGQDFTFTFAPVARWDSIRALLCLAAIHDFELRQLDVKTAYLNGPLDEEIYMKAPEGFNYSAPFWRLRKGLYGLRQAGRQWYLTLHQAYSDLGYTRCESDWSVYTRHSASGSSMSATSVDDILIASDSKTESDKAAAEINDKFSVTDSGDAEWILGCQITRSRQKRLLMIDQCRFTTSILRQYKMDGCNPLPTPSPMGRLTSEMSPQNDSEREAVANYPYNQYPAIVGKCMYLATCTRPDISFSVRELARFMSNYGKRHYDAAKHLLRYLNGTRSRGIIYGDVENLTPIFRSFTDSDWAMSDNRKSISGYLIECGGGPITWSSKQQAIIALSSCEAEYISCAHCARQIIWLRTLFDELGYPQTQPSDLYCDNQGTVACTHDPHSHSRMKHIDIRTHFIRDCVNNNLVHVHHIPGVDNPADLLTKPLPKITHQKWLCRIRLNINQESMAR
jgi:Reverse transcriptase (RNA-dependent DNA polymerase)